MKPNSHKVFINIADFQMVRHNEVERLTLGVALLVKKIKFSIIRHRLLSTAFRAIVFSTFLRLTFNIPRSYGEIV